MFGKVVIQILTFNELLVIFSVTANDYIVIHVAYNYESVKYQSQGWVNTMITVVVQRVIKEPTAEK